MPKPIYYLVSVSNDEEHIMAFSFDKQILENIINEHPEKNEDYKLVIKENLKIYNIWISYDSINQCKKYQIMYVNSLIMQPDYTKSKLYAFNMTKRINNGLDYIIEEGIINLDCFYDKVNEIPMLKDKISVNPILFDTFYEEGVMNA